jgi:predicted nuclease with TOPRIM domain
LDERFKTAESAIQTITTQLIDQTNKSSELRQSTFETSDRIAALDQKLLELDRLKATMEVLEGEISSNKTQFMTLFDELSSLSAVAQVVDINKDTLSKHNDSLRQILVDYESIQKQLFRLDSEAKRLDDLMAFNKVDIESMLKRLDELEIIQPELSEQSFLRDRLSEIQYKQSMMDEDKSLIAELQSRVLSLEAKLERFENLESKILTLEEKLQNFESNQQMADPANSPTSVPE